MDDRGAQYNGADVLAASEEAAHGFEGNYSSVRVGVERRAPAGGAALAKIQSIERKQREAEVRMFEQVRAGRRARMARRSRRWHLEARKDMRTLTSVALAELSERRAPRPVRARALRRRQGRLARGARAPGENVTGAAFFEGALRGPVDRAIFWLRPRGARAPDSARGQADVRVAAPASPFPAVADLVEAGRA